MNISFDIIELASGSGARRGRPNPGAHSVSASLCGKCPYKRTVSAPAAVSLAPQTTDHRHGTAHYIPYPHHCVKSVRTNKPHHTTPYDATHYLSPTTLTKVPTLKVVITRPFPVDNQTGSRFLNVFYRT